jgi:hypothetical protein
MKRNEIERLSRELKRQQKHATREDRCTDAAGDVKTYALELFELLQYDSDSIFNTREDEDLLDLFLEMKDDLPESKWPLVIKKAVRLTKVKEKDMAFTELHAALDCC